LIDGLELATHMVDTGVGVTTLETYELKRIDEDYFSEVE
jgi:restriction system protein